MKSSKPAVTSASTPSTRAIIASGSSFEKSETASAHSDSITTQSNKEPSWPPHTAATR